MKYYFNDSDDSDDSGSCYPLDYWQEQLKEEQLPEMKLRLAKMVKGEPFFFCSYFLECCESNDSTCGKRNCEHYKPRNGKNGRCVDHKNCYEGTDETIVIKLKQ
jgi:hypothetical protein